MAITLCVGNDSDVTLSGVNAGGTYLNSGTATWTLKTTAGATVASGTLAYVAASSGDYAGVIESTDFSAATVGRYTMVFTFAQSGYNARWDEPCSVVYRSS